MKDQHANITAPAPPNPSLDGLTWLHCIYHKPLASGGGLRGRMLCPIFSRRQPYGLWSSFSISSLDHYRSEVLQGIGQAGHGLPALQPAVVPFYR